jgi:hypothetical protein
MANYWLQQDVLNIIKDYTDCDELLSDLLKLTAYDDHGKAQTQNITNINFICNKDKIESILKDIAENNDGKITIIKED